MVLFRKRERQRNKEEKRRSKQSYSTVEQQHGRVSAKNATKNQKRLQLMRCNAPIVMDCAVNGSTYAPPKESSRKRYISNNKNQGTTTKVEEIKNGTRKPPLPSAVKDGGEREEKAEKELDSSSALSPSSTSISTPLTNKGQLFRDDGVLSNDNSPQNHQLLESSECTTGIVDVRSRETPTPPPSKSKPNQPVTPSSSTAAPLLQQKPLKLTIKEETFTEREDHRRHHNNDSINTNNKFDQQQHLHLHLLPPKLPPKNSNDKAITSCYTSLYEKYNNGDIIRGSNNNNSMNTDGGSSNNNVDDDIIDNLLKKKILLPLPPTPHDTLPKRRRGGHSRSRNRTYRKYNGDDEADRLLLASGNKYNNSNIECHKQREVGTPRYRESRSSLRGEHINNSKEHEKEITGHICDDWNSINKQCNQHQQKLTKQKVSAYHHQQQHYNSDQYLIEEARSVSTTVCSSGIYWEERTIDTGNKDDSSSNLNSNSVSACRSIDENSLNNHVIEKTTASNEIKTNGQREEDNTNDLVEEQEKAEENQMLFLSPDRDSSCSNDSKEEEKIQFNGVNAGTHDETNVHLHGREVLEPLPYHHYSDVEDWRSCSSSHTTTYVFARVRMIAKIKQALERNASKHKLQSNDSYKKLSENIASRDIARTIELDLYRSAVKSFQQYTDEDTFEDRVEQALFGIEMEASRSSQQHKDRGFFFGDDYSATSSITMCSSTYTGSTSTTSVSSMMSMPQTPPREHILSSHPFHQNQQHYFDDDDVDMVMKPLPVQGGGGRSPCNERTSIERFKRARTTYRDTILESLYERYGEGSNNDYIARALVVLGMIEYRLERFNDAKMYCKRALKMYQRLYGANGGRNMNTVKTLQLLSEIEHSLGNHNKAREYEMKSEAMSMSATSSKQSGVYIMI